MKTHLVKAFKKFVAAALVALCVFASLGFEILDKDKNNLFFRKVADPLDKLKIDIVQDWSSNVELRGRPTLAPIANYNVSVLSKQNKWTIAYTNLYANAIVALETKQTTTASTFIRTWEASPTEKRVFISFTKEDLFHAERIKTTLEQEGYKVFLYTENNRLPFTSPDMIVYCMKTAGEVLVLDTENSRNKIGVIAEALAFAKYSYKPEKQIIAENELLKQQVRATISEMQIESPTREEIIDNTIKMYEDNSGKTFSRDEIKQKIRETYQANMDEFITGDLSAKGKEAYINYLLDDEGLTPYAYNKKLATDITYLKENPIIKLSKLDSILNFVSYFGFCPYYKIPIRLCPICSKG